MTSVVEDYAYIAKRLREITNPVPVADADDANEPLDDDDFHLMGYMADAI